MGFVGVAVNSQTEMDKQQLELRIREVLVASLSLDVSPVDIPIDRPIDDLIGLDSMAILEYVIALEKEFGIFLEPEALRLDLLTDIPRLSQYITACLESKDKGI